MGNTKSQRSNQTELKEISRYDLDQIKDLPTQEAAKKITSLFYKAVSTKNTTLKNSLQNPLFLQSILFKELRAYKQFVPFLKLLRNSLVMGPVVYFTKWAPTELLVFIIIMYDVSLPENILEYFESSNISSTFSRILNIVKNCNLPVDKDSINNIVVARMLNSMVVVRKGFRDDLVKFIADNSTEIRSKFPVLLQGMVSAEIVNLLSCVGQLDDYMIECIVDRFSFWVRGKLSKSDCDRLEPHNLHSKILKIMSTIDFDNWVACFLICSLKSSKDRVKNSLESCPFIFMTKNIVYRLDQSNSQ